jgi:hypothetical protein
VREAAHLHPRGRVAERNVKNVLCRDDVRMKRESQRRVPALTPGDDDGVPALG